MKDHKSRIDLSYIQPIVIFVRADEPKNHAQGLGYYHLEGMIQSTRMVSLQVQASPDLMMSLNHAHYWKIIGVRFSLGIQSSLYHCRQLGTVLWSIFPCLTRLDRVFSHTVDGLLRGIC